jgi:sugar/nucleoside kinase (ribokinase family)
MDVLTFGSIIVDIITKSSQIKKVKLKDKQLFALEYGSKLEAEFIDTFFGGSAHNVAFGLAVLGRKTGIIGCIGEDEFGKTVLSELQQAGVNTDGIQFSSKPTGKSIVLIGEDNERSIIIYRGANDFIDEKKISQEYINLFRCFVFTSVLGEKSLSALDKAVKIANRKGLLTIANPSASMIRKNKKHLLQLLARCRMAIMNEEEAYLLTGKKMPKSLEAIKNLGPDTVVVTQGSKGCMAIHGNRVYQQKAFKTRVVDTTGAGDAFTAGFIHSMLRKDSMEYALKFASVCASLNIKSVGAVKNFPTENDIIKVLGEKNV